MTARLPFRAERLRDLLTEPSTVTELARVAAADLGYTEHVPRGGNVRALVQSDLYRLRRRGVVLVAANGRPSVWARTTTGYGHEGSESVSARREVLLWTLRACTRPTSLDDLVKRLLHRPKYTSAIKPLCSPIAAIVLKDLLALHSADLVKSGGPSPWEATWQDTLWQAVEVRKPEPEPELEWREPEPDADDLAAFDWVGCGRGEVHCSSYSLPEHVEEVLAQEPVTFGWYDPAPWQREAIDREASQSRRNGRPFGLGAFR